MVIEPLVLDFFRVPSCAAAGLREPEPGARISVIVGSCGLLVGRSSRRVYGWGRLHDSTGVPVPCPNGRGRRRNGKHPEGGLNRSEPPEGAGHEPGGDAHRARSPRRPGGPRRAYYGIHTLCALENFRSRALPSPFIRTSWRALACVKRRRRSRTMPSDCFADDRPARSCGPARVREGELLDQFLVDVIQGGAGLRPT